MVVHFLGSAFLDVFFAQPVLFDHFVDELALATVVRPVRPVDVPIGDHHIELLVMHDVVVFAEQQILGEPQQIIVEIQVVEAFLHKLVHDLATVSLHEDIHLPSEHDQVVSVLEEHFHRVLDLFLEVTVVKRRQLLEKAARLELAVSVSEAFGFALRRRGHPMAGHLFF